MIGTALLIGLLVHGIFALLYHDLNSPTFQKNSPIRRVKIGIITYCIIVVT